MLITFVWLITLEFVTDRFMEENTAVPCTLQALPAAAGNTAFVVTMATS